MELELHCFYCEKEYNLKDIFFKIPPKGKPDNPRPNRGEPICYKCYGENIPEKEWGFGYKLAKHYKETGNYDLLSIHN